MTTIESIRLDSRLQASLAKYNGPASEFAAWRFVFEAFVGSQCEPLLSKMGQAETMPAPITISTLDPVEQEMSRKLYFALAHTLKGTPLTTIMNVQEKNGFEQCRRLVRKEMPGLCTS